MIPIWWGEKVQVLTGKLGHIMCGWTQCSITSFAILHDFIDMDSLHGSDGLSSVSHYRTRLACAHHAL